MPRVRTPSFSDFYRGDLRAEIERFLARYVEPPPEAPPLVAAVVPHAGWRYSGGVAARTLKTLADRSAPSRVVLLGAVHRAPIASASVYARGAWETPLGRLEVDAALAQEILEGLGALVVEDPESHEDEHSIEVQTPFIAEFFPGVPILPVLVPPRREALELGRRLGQILRGRSSVVVGTTDLTHYGDVYGFAPAGCGEEAHRWMEENDRRILDLAVRMEAEAIPEEARRHGNACGWGALAAAVACARELGATRGTVVERTDSYRVEGRPEPFRMAVGYAGIVF
ncbi:MAG: AmmeMemoRadiSam system protein B [Planctomycetota bacterium]